MVHVYDMGSISPYHRWFELDGEYAGYTFENTEYALCRNGDILDWMHRPILDTALATVVKHIIISEGIREIG